MKDRIHILCLEDVELDAVLVQHALRKGRIDFTWKRVKTVNEFRQELRDNPPDIVLSDSAFPAFDGLTALGIAQKERPQIPFFFITSSVEEEDAIETLKKGATDYVLKTHLSRLVPAVRRALKDTESEANRGRARERLRQSRRELRALSMHLQEVREAERKRMAREIHDELGQALTGLQLDVSALKEELPQELGDLKGKATAISRRIDETIETVRRISTELRPGVLDELGLVAAIEWQVREFQKRTGIGTRVILNIEEPELPDEVKTAFFRILQETLTNVIRHANAKRVEVRLRIERGKFVMEITDNGRGITEQQIASPRSLGLIGMRERATLHKCDFQIKRQSGKGTKVTVRSALPTAPAAGESV